MMMCVDTIKRVKALSKEIRIQSSLRSSRKVHTRALTFSGRSKSASASKTVMNQDQVKVNRKSLAQLQEDMKNDFVTATQKEARKHLTKKRSMSRKDRLEASMRLLGIHKMPNRFRISDDGAIP